MQSVSSAQTKIMAVGIFGSGVEMNAGDLQHLKAFGHQCVEDGQGGSTLLQVDLPCSQLDGEGGRGFRDCSIADQELFGILF